MSGTGCFGSCWEGSSLVLGPGRSSRPALDAVFVGFGAAAEDDVNASFSVNKTQTGWSLTADFRPVRLHWKAAFFNKWYS